jgi:hypothetical protein
MRLLGVVALCAAVVGATGAVGGSAEAKGPALLSFGLGQFDNDAIDTGSAGLFFDVGNDAGRNKATEFRVEYRFGTELYAAGDWFSVRPFVGGSTTSDGMLYGLGGVLFDFTWGNFVFTPSFGAGLWRRGDGKDLGHGIEFRTMFEVGYRFDNEARVTAAFSHMSNANISDTNPGANSLMLYVHLPVGAIFGD